MVQILKIQAKKEIHYINLDHFVSASPSGMGRWTLVFINPKESIEVSGEDAKAILAHLDAMAIPVGLDDDA